MACADPGFSRPWWLRGSFVETVWPRRIGPMPPYSREIVNTFDNDPVAFDSLAGAPGAPAIAIFHGLEGCSGSQAVRRCSSWFNARGWHVTVPHFRTCGVMNRLPRAYHAGDSKDVGWMLSYIKASCEPGTPLYAIGISLGGNALAKWLGENPGQDTLAAAAAVCAPLDLPACSRRLAKTFNNFTYGRHFLGRLKGKMRHKLKSYPFLATHREIDKISSVREFDERFTAPLHNFKSVDDYYEHAAALPLLGAVDTPLLCLHSSNDALVTVPSLPANPSLELAVTRGGGHCGFTTAPFPGQTSWLPQHIEGFFARAA